MRESAGKLVSALQEDFRRFHLFGLGEMSYVNESFATAKNFLSPSYSSSFLLAPPSPRSSPFRLPSLTLLLP